jgi:hypothetical protein
MVSFAMQAPGRSVVQPRIPEKSRIAVEPL